MRTIILTTALCLVGHAAMAGHSGDEQGAPGGTQIHTTAAAGAAARSQSVAHSKSVATGGAARATGGRASAVTGPVTVNNSAPAGGYGGGGYSARGNTPDALPPSINGGEPCTVSASAGVSMFGIGLAGGGSTPDKGCETRQRAAILQNMGFRSAAKQLLCADTFYSNAFAQAGEPCDADVRRWNADGYYRDARGVWRR